MHFKRKLLAAAVVVAGFGALGILSPQTRNAPAFEVVSFKHSGNYLDGGNVRPMRSLQFKGGRLNGDVPLYGIIQKAYPLDPPQYSGPDWLVWEYYEIKAIAPAGTTPDAIPAMLQTMLAERLGFKYHFASKETPIYALVAGNGTAKLTPSTGGDPPNGTIHLGVFKEKAASLADLAGFLGSLMDRQVFDRTGIKGRYQFDLDWSKEIHDAMQEFGQRGDPSIALIGVRKLGLKLEPRKEPLKMLVVDHVNKEPTPN